MPDNRTVAIVTGASRGVGKGVAIALGSHGCTVYVTGRSERTGDSSLPGGIYETADLVTAAGGKGIAVRVDHGDDDQVKALIDQVQREQGRLDILVNNVCALHDRLTEPGSFWEKPIELVDMLDVGLRSSYVATYYAAPMLAAQRHGLVTFTSARGAMCYTYGPAYGAHKAGLDKFAADMAVEFKAFGVAVLSVWPGGVLTDRLKMVVASDPVKFSGVLETAETPEFTGHVIWALHSDPKLMEMTGQTVIGAEMAVKYAIKDEGGRQPPSWRDTHGVAPRLQPWPATP